MIPSVWSCHRVRVYEGWRLCYCCDRSLDFIQTLTYAQEHKGFVHFVSRLIYLCKVVESRLRTTAARE